MKSFLVLLFLICDALVASAQGVAPFWEPLAGPQGAQGSNLRWYPDSQEVATVAGGTVFVYDPGTQRWIPVPRGINSLPPLQVLGRAVPWLISNETMYAVYRDTVFYTSDNGSHWQSLGSFGTPKTSPIRGLVLTPSGHVAILNDSGSLFISTNHFAATDTEHVPELPRLKLINDADTLYINTVYGNIFRSIDLGKTWDSVYGFRSITPDFHSSLFVTNHTWYLTGERVSTTFPYAVTDDYFAYSNDRGRTWHTKALPQQDQDFYLAGQDSAGRIYLHQGHSDYRSDDTGRTWLLIPISPYYISRDGSLYTTSDSGYVMSTDHGSTWQLLGNTGIYCVPRSMAETAFRTWVAGSDSIYYSETDGQSWNGTGQKTGYLSAGPDSIHQLMFNTTTILYPPTIDNTPCHSQSPQNGFGIITSGFYVWLVDNRSAISICESVDSGCSFTAFDTISAAPIRAIVETTRDTVLVASTSAVVKVYDAIPGFGQLAANEVTPERDHSHPTGALARDSSGAILVGMNDGRLFVTRDGGNSWQSFPSPVEDSVAPIQHLAAGPGGYLFAVDSNLQTARTRIYEYNPAKQAWSDVSESLLRPEYSDTAIVTNVWCINNYAYAGTLNLGLFRSASPISSESVIQTIEHHSQFRLYPNPASKRVTVTYPSTVHGSLTITDATGRVWIRQSVDPSARQLDVMVTDLPAGAYVVSIGSALFWPAKLFVLH